jgi:tetratricopeptide (TPR) repeat protein
VPGLADIRSIFANALELAAADRAAYLDGACGDAAARAEVDRLLAAHDRAGPFLGGPAGGETRTAGPAAAAGDPDTRSWETPPAEPGLGEIAGAVIAGRYKLLEPVGAGGMGTVWMAQQTEPVRRLVAVKLIKPGMDSGAVLTRFEAERQALALMDHPNIARVLDAGATADGRPFFVMELVRGVPITQFCDERQLTPRARLELFVPVCRAVQHAHQKGIIHRDVKPSNALVALYDDAPVPKVIDFGVAKAAGEPLTDRTLVTGFGAVVGTPAYMAPEQATLNNLDVDTRADVYGLGALLYELLSGSPPFDRADLQKAGLLEVLRVVREEEPPRPSARVSTSTARPAVAAARGTDPGRLAGLLRSDLDWVVMKALEKDRGRRYESAAGLAEDVERYLAGEPVVAAPPSAGYRVRKFVRRHRAGVAVAAVLGVAVAAGVAGTVTGLIQSGRAAAERAQRELEEARRAGEEDARLARNAEAVAAQLGQCEEAIRAGDTARAATALEVARKRSAEGGAEHHAGRLGRLAADVALVRDLDAADQFRWTWSGSRFPHQEPVAARIREALGRFGADPDVGSVESAARRVAESAVRERAVAALDFVLRYAPLEHLARVRALLRRLDDDPYRNALRDAILTGDKAKLAELTNRGAALQQAPGFATVLANYPEVQKERRRAILRAAVSRRPGNVDLLMSLGSIYLRDGSSPDEQLRWYQAAAAADPANYAAHINVGVTLHTKGRVDEAVAYYKRALELDPNQGVGHLVLGRVLAERGRVDEAIASFRRGLELDPENAVGHNNLGITLCMIKRDYDGAIASFRRATQLDPNYANAYFNLGVALQRKGQFDGCIASFEKAISINPQFARAYVALGIVLRRQGRFAESLAVLQRGRERVTRQPDLSAVPAKLIRQAESIAPVAAKFPAFLRGEYQPANARDRLLLLYVCHTKKHYRAAAGLAATVFAADPAVAADLRSQHRYEAACSAALAAAGRGEDAAALDGAAKAKLRAQALDWLRADLADRAKLLDAGSRDVRPLVVEALRQWQSQPDLAGLRDTAALAKLPADERKAFTQLWADVAAVAKRAEEKAGPEPSSTKPAGKGSGSSPPRDKGAAARSVPKPEKKLPPPETAPPPRRRE